MDFYRKNMIQTGQTDKAVLANTAPCLIIEPFLNSTYNGYQDPMHASKPISNSMIRNNQPDDALVELDSFGWNGDDALTLDASINPLGNIPLPYIPEQLLCSLSNTMFEPKQYAEEEGELKKTNSHAKKNHKV
jgi:hypothetical protein